MKTLTENPVPPYNEPNPIPPYDEPVSPREQIYAELHDEERRAWEFSSPTVRPSGMTVRKFDTGATRDTDTGKYDYEAFLCPLVVQRFGQYMHKHRKQNDGTMRDGDNWQKGIPTKEYLKSLLRHSHDLWLVLRGYPNEAREDLETACCAILFNVQGILHNVLKKKLQNKACGTAGLGDHVS